LLPPRLDSARKRVFGTVHVEMRQRKRGGVAVTTRGTECVAGVAGSLASQEE
jgi:hypothetical protein